jgi:tyrosyl-tRNA synthetase
MLVRDDFEKRYKKDKPISMIEFLYPLLQAYDSVALNADVEIGGNDQKFNLLLGRQIQKDYGIKDAQVVIIMPLLEGTDGIKKMSKSYNNYISLNDSSEDMFGKIMSISDSIMYRYYELLTNIDLNMVKDMHPKDAKKLLAREIVKRYHGAKESLKAQEEFDRIFTKRNLPENIEKCIIENIPIKLSDILIKSIMVSSKNEARRLIEQGAIKINSQKISDDIIISDDREFVLQVGKRKFKKITPITS